MSDEKNKNYQVGNSIIDDDEPIVNEQNEMMFVNTLYSNPNN